MKGNAFLWAFLPFQRKLDKTCFTYQGKVCCSGGGSAPFSKTIFFMKTLWIGSGTGEDLGGGGDWVREQEENECPVCISHHFYVSLNTWRLAVLLCLL